MEPTEEKRKKRLSKSFTMRRELRRMGDLEEIQAIKGNRLKGFISFNCQHQPENFSCSSSDNVTLYSCMSLYEHPTLDSKLNHGKRRKLIRLCEIETQSFVTFIAFSPP